MRKNRKQLLACLLAVSIGPAAVTGCGRPGSMGGAGGGTGSGPAPAGAEILAQAEYPQEPVYKNDEERYEARYSRKIPERFQEAYGSFAMRTAAAVLGEDSQANTVYSPLGLYYALAMSAQGAGGETRRELLSLLGYPEDVLPGEASDSPGSGAGSPDSTGLALESLAQDCQAAFQALYHVPNPANAKKNQWGELPSDALYNLRIANSLWADHILEIRQEFADQAARYFYSDSFRTDLHGPEGAQAMADWVRDRTGGMIVPAAREVPAEEQLSLQNTVYYFDEWIDRFQKDRTRPDVFTTAEGIQVTCDFMNREMDSHGFRRGENFTASSLGLKNGSVLFVLPDPGVDVRELVQSPEILEEVLEGTSGQGTGEVIWKIPKFSYGSSRKLSGVLEDLGIRKALGPDGDFSGISDQKPLFLSGISQDVQIGLDENGVEAAAFTEIAYAGAAPPDGRAEMILDRPFLYAVRSQGQLLFVGICGNPRQNQPEDSSVSAEIPETGASHASDRECWEKLLEARNPYMGDASANGKLVKLVLDHYHMDQGWTMELQTTYLPCGLTLHLDQAPDNITMQKAAGLLLGLIDNCYSVSWDYPVDGQGNRAYFYMPWALSPYQDIVQKEDQVEKVGELLELLEQIDRPLPERSRSRTLDQAVAAAVLENNRYIYSQDCEAYGEGHKLLGQEETGDRVVVYALTMYGSYQFQNGNFVKNGGTGTLPVVIQVAKEPDGSYVAVHYQRPEDGGGYQESIRKLFPEELWARCLSPAAQDQDDLTMQEQAYAKSYLEQIGREAEIGDYGDFPHTLLTDVGVPVEVSNALGDIRESAPDDPAWLAPSWLGTIERLEDGERYVYEQAYDEEKKEILFSKIRYETGETVAQSVYDALTGDKK